MMIMTKVTIAHTMAAAQINGFVGRSWPMADWGMGAKNGLAHYKKNGYFFFYFSRKRKETLGRGKKLDFVLTSKLIVKIQGFCKVLLVSNVLVSCFPKAKEIVHNLVTLQCPCFHSP